MEKEKPLATFQTELGPFALHMVLIRGPDGLAMRRVFGLQHKARDPRDLYIVDFESGLELPKGCHLDPIECADIEAAASKYQVIYAKTRQERWKRFKKALKEAFNHLRA